MLLDAIPANIDILHLHTDMQGSDFAAIKSAGDALKRVRSLQTEVFLGKSDYKLLHNVSNHIDAWMPYMSALGYNLEKIQRLGGEGDAHWTIGG